MGASYNQFVQELTHIEREAGYALLCDDNDVAWQSCIDQFNDIYNQLIRVDDEIRMRFSPLSNNDTAGTVRMAVRDLIFFLEQ